MKQEISLESLFSNLDTPDAPGAVVSVMHKGKVLLRRGVGLANIDCSALNTPATKMRIASTTKHFAVILTLLLRDEGRLSIDEPVLRWLPELPASQGARTLRQFMNHTGGTRDFLDLTLLSNAMGMIPDDAAFEYQCMQRDDNFAAGERFSYNNGGYRMLSMVIERVLGMPIADVMRERLFEPLGMNDTSLWPLDMVPLRGMAQTYLARPGGSFLKGMFPTATLGEGGIASTVDDMQRWASHLVRPALWSSSLLDELTAPTTLSNGYVGKYGLGLMSERFGGVRIIHHAGTAVGGTSQMLVAPDHDLQIVVMTNRSDASAPELAQKILAAVTGASAAATPANISAIEGLRGAYYCADEGRHFAVDALKDRPVLQIFGMSVPLLQSPQGALKVDHTVLQLDVHPVRDAAGHVIAIDVGEQGRVLRCERVEPVQPGEDVCSAFAGVWRSDELDAAFAIADGEMTVSGRYGRSRFRLAPLRENACAMVSADVLLPFGGTLRKVRDSQGKQQLVLETTRTRGLRLAPAEH